MSAIRGFLPLTSPKLKRAAYPAPFTATFEEVAKRNGTTLAMRLGFASSYSNLREQLTMTFGKSRVASARVALSFDARDAAVARLNGKTRDLLKGLKVKPGGRSKSARFYFHSVFHFSLE